MALWRCAACTAAFAVGLPRCPQCGSAERADEVTLKISRQGVLSDDAALRRHPGTGEEVHGTEAPADGTFTEIGNDPVPGAPEPVQVTQLSPGEPAVPEPVAPPRVPPRRAPVRPPAVPRE